jgi:hypothetical protein
MLDNEVSSDNILDPAAFLSIEDANIAALHHRHQHGRGPPPSQGGHNGSRGFNPEKPIPCKYAPCGVVALIHPTFAALVTHPHIVSVAAGTFKVFRLIASPVSPPSSRLKMQVISHSLGLRSQPSTIRMVLQLIPMTPTSRKSPLICKLSKHSFIQGMIFRLTALPSTISTLSTPRFLLLTNSIVTMTLLRCLTSVFLVIPVMTVTLAPTASCRLVMSLLCLLTYRGMVVMTRTPMRPIHSLIGSLIGLSDVRCPIAMAFNRLVTTGMPLLTLPKDFYTLIILVRPSGYCRYRCFGTKPP